jgi:vanillate O-demethylase ferredoxin subunit
MPTIASGFHAAQREWLDVVVARKSREAVGICSLELVDTERRALPSYAAGAHILVEVDAGLSRSYSLYTLPGTPCTYRIAVLRDPASRGGSTAVHDLLQQGQRIRVSPPRNSFPLDERAPYSVLLAGGIGVTPILSMVEQLASTNRPFEMHYCARSRSNAAFVDRLDGSAYRSRVRLHFDDGPPSQRLDIASTLAGCPPGTHLYVCGPRGFIDAVLAAAAIAGWPDDRLHTERFSADVAAHADDGSFDVELARSGRVVRIEKDKTVVQALADAGLALDTSCEQGICGVCVTRVLAGVPDHRDMFLTDDEKARNDQFTPCCSRALGPRLVLDL